MMRLCHVFYFLLNFYIKICFCTNEIKLLLSSTVLFGQHVILESSTELVYQIPQSLSSIKGVIFLAHGCSHSATDWWPKSSTCPKCIGLPVETSIVRDALLRNYAVLSISSINRQHKCWSGKDIDRVQIAISYFYKKVLNNSTKIPLYLLGASSGGSFVGYLGQQRQFLPVRPSAICVQISAVQGENLQYLPPTLFVLMNRDEHSLQHIKSLLSDKRSIIKSSKILITQPKPITAQYFYLKSNGIIHLEESQRIHQALLEAEYIDAKTFLLLTDPRESDWRNYITSALLPRLIPEEDSLVADLSMISELLNLAWNMHEITDNYNQETFEFFEASSSGTKVEMQA